MGDAATSRMALPGLPRPSLRPPAGIQPAFGRSGLSLPVPTQRKSGSLLDYDASSWPAWKQRWLVFDSDEQQDEYRADRMVPAYFKLFGIGSLMTALVVALDMARELGAGTATPARIAVSSLAIVAYLAVVLHTSLAKPEVHSGRRTQHRKSFLFRHGLEVWLAVAMVLTCIRESTTGAGKRS